jgi:hypothetical protein
MPIITKFAEFSRLYELYQEEADSTFTHNGAEYSLNRLLSITEAAPIEMVPVNQLAWVLAYDSPEQARVDRADTTAPILVTFMQEPTVVSVGRGKVTITVPQGQKVVLDGLHRLARAMQDGIQVLPARMVTPAQLSRCLLGQASV